MFKSPFIKNNEYYVRDYNVIDKYINDSAFFIHKMKNIDFDKSVELVKKVISKNGKSPLVNPKLLILERESNGDKFQKESTFLDYLESTQRDSDLCSPSMTTYLHPSKKESIISRYLSEGMERRDNVKKDGQRHEMSNNDVLASYCYNLQTAIKIIINSVSGTHGSAGTPLYNHSAHPTLTSTGRCATSYANSNNERFLEGMRHYWNYDIAQSDMISIVANSDYKKIRKTITKFSLFLPETEDIVEVIRKSTNLYWRDESKIEKLTKLIDTFTPIERAAYLYTQDCHSLYTFNPELVTNMILDFCKVETEEIEDPDKWISMMDDDIKMTVGIIASKILNGRSLENIKENDNDAYNLFAGTVKHFLEVREKYYDLIETFWGTDHIPSSIAVYPSAVRRSVIVSDTDSTIFTVANWVERVYGKMTFDDIGKSIGAVMVYLSSQTLKHVLAIYSGNMGVIPERIFQLTMKNEYIIESLIVTTKAKTYACRIIAKEGNVFAKPKLDVKGAALRSSKIPNHVRVELNTMINDLLDDTKNGNGVSIIKYLTKVANLERDIYHKIKGGSSEYLSRIKINPKEAYRSPMTQSYYYYELWQEVFAFKYGDITLLPCVTIKVSLDIDNKTQFQMWLDKINDEDIVNRLKEFMAKTNRTKVSMILVPLEVALRDGIPEEILIGANIRKIIATTVDGFYLILESIGYYCRNDEFSRLVMDNY